MIVAKDTAAQDLAGHLPQFTSLVRGAWSDVESLPDDVRVVMSPRTRACAVHDFMVSRAAGYAARTEGVVCFERQLMHGLIVDGKYAIRFKKLDEDGLSRNQPTAQVMEFRSQIELDGIEALHHLEVGYVLNSFGTEIVDILITCPAGRGNAWAMSIKDHQALTVVANIFDQLVPDTVPEAVIKPRNAGAAILPFRKSEER